MKEKIIDFVKKILMEDYDLYNVEVKPTSSFRNDFGLDSLDVMEIIQKVEMKYNISIPYTESDTIETVQDIIDVVCNKLNCAPK